MAGDWLKMRCNLWEDPRVVRLAAVLKMSRAAVVGSLYRTWTLADQYTEDGELDGYDRTALDEAVAKKGWAQALAEIGWLEIYPDHLTVPRFDEHNGASAKKRAANLKDQQRRRGQVSVRTLSGSEPDINLTREEKSKRRVREEDVDVDDDRFSCSEEEYLEFRRLFAILTKAARPENDDARQWMAKAAILFIRGQVSEDIWHQVIESYQVKSDIQTPGWAWDRFEKGCPTWRQLLVRTDVPSGWLNISN